MIIIIIIIIIINILNIASPELPVVWSGLKIS
jgi:hypothetical protein